MSDSRVVKLISQLPDAVFKKMGVSNKDTVINEFVRKKLPATHHNEIAREMDKRFFIGKLSRAKIFKRREEKRRARRRKAELGLLERRKLSFDKLPKKGLKFDEVEKEIHSLFCQYINELLQTEFLKEKGFTGDPTDKHWDEVSTKLSKADLHGAYVVITRSVNPGFVGTEGIIVFETKNVFQIIGRNNIIKTMPKKHCEFLLMLDDFNIKFFGKDMCARPGDRIHKRFKTSKYDQL